MYRSILLFFALLLAQYIATTHAESREGSYFAHYDAQQRICGHLSYAFTLSRVPTSCLLGERTHLQKASRVTIIRASIRQIFSVVTTGLIEFSLEAAPDHFTIDCTAASLQHMFLEPTSIPRISQNASHTPLFHRVFLFGQCSIYSIWRVIMSFTLPDLPYAYDALEPYIDARTMEIHYSKHHQGYTNKANAALEGTPWADKSAEEILQHLNDIPEKIRTAVRNNVGGFFNHSLFWQILAPAGKGGGGEPTGDLAEALNQVFGSLDGFKDEFTKAAATRFGSGWAWLGFDGDGKLHVGSTPNQDTPITFGHIPILGLDVWEHAYYLHYQNRRPDYINAFWNIVNWGKVSELFDNAR